MAKTVCKAVKQGIVKRRGRPSIEWYKNGVPQYYCYGYIDLATDDLFEVCRNCIDHVDHAAEDYEKWKKGKAENKKAPGPRENPGAGEELKY